MKIQNYILVFILLPVFLFSQKDLETAKQLIEDKDYEAAVQILENLVENDINNWELHHWLGVAYVENSKLPGTGMFKAMKYLKRGKESLHKATEMNPDDIKARENLAYSYYYPPKIAGGDKDKALEQVAEIEKRDPKLALKISIEFLQFDSEYEQAVEKCEEYITLYPQDYEIYHTLGMIYQDKEEYAKAFKAFETVIAQDPTALNSLYQIGRTSVYSGQKLERGVVCLQTFLQYEPGEDEPSLDAAHWRLGMIYEKQGKLNLAKDEYEEAVRLDPDDKDYKRSLKNLKKEQENL